MYDDAQSRKAVYHSQEQQDSLSKEQIRWPEEVLALQFNHAKKLAKDAAGGETVIDVVVTVCLKISFLRFSTNSFSVPIHIQQVPIFFTQPERQAILDAIELAGLHPLALLDDGSAVAINYAMTRTFPAGTKENHLFYDAGAGSIRATIVSFATAEVKEHASSKLLKNVTTAEVRGIGWDRSAGGLVLDSAIRDILEQQFISGQGKNLAQPFADNKRAQAKLLKEAARVKQVLSANVEASSRIEGLAEDVDFRGSVSREEFEAACRSVQASFAKPIHDALEIANLSISDIESVVLVGGSSRVPMVQTAIKDLVSEEKIAQNLNADEAAVMGAALYGAGISKQFRTKDIRITGLTPYAIDVAYEAESKAGGKECSLLIVNKDS